MRSKINEKSYGILDRSLKSSWALKGVPGGFRSACPGSTGRPILNRRVNLPPPRPPRRENPPLASVDPTKPPPLPCQGNKGDGCGEACLAPRPGLASLGRPVASLWCSLGLRWHPLGSLWLPFLRLSRPLGIPLALPWLPWCALGVSLASYWRFRAIPLDPFRIPWPPFCSFG